ncbi:MAG: hypothetical protein LUH15_05940 [Tannerellaceae bacterium]|nr:hypothetical protein [Tannerellaceae bacterium]
MKHIESLLSFLLAVASLLLPRKKRLPCMCPYPAPSGSNTAIPPDGCPLHSAATGGSGCMAGEG